MTGRVFSQRPLYALTITGAQSNVNVRTSLSSPSIAGDVLVTITSTGVVNSTSGSPALRWGTGWPAGCTFKTVIAGAVRGSSGVGGQGGTGTNGLDGTAGNNAMDLDGNAVAVDLGTTGQLLGGGGGGGGGGAGSGGTGGGGGGGGQGDLGTGSGGAAGGGTHPGSAGNAGGPSGPGLGGAGGTGGITNGGDGGQGGGWGDPGTAGATVAGAGGNPGSGGKAINLNGGSVTWIAGNNATQVRGAVS